jgi:hypothetical protein
MTKQIIFNNCKQLFQCDGLLITPRISILIKKLNAMKKTETSEKLKEDSKKIAPQKAEEIKTEGPLSEKDEVKQAEEKMRKRVKK